MRICSPPRRRPTFFVFAFDFACVLDVYAVSFLFGCFGSSLFGQRKLIGITEDKNANKLILRRRRNLLAKTKWIYVYIYVNKNEEEKYKRK